MRWPAPLAALVLLAVPTSAAASSAVLLPRAGGSGVGADVRDEAVAAVARTLENELWQVYRVEDASPALAPRLAACSPEDRCGWELAQLMGVDVAIGVRVWGDEDRVERVAVVVIGERGVGQGAVAEVDPSIPIDFAAAEATRGAVQAWRTGRGAFAPPRDPTADPTLDDSELGPDPLNWVLGSFLILGSSPLLGFGINTLVREGECVTEGPGGTCVERVRFQEGAGIFTGIGAALLVAGVVVWIAQPLRLTVRADRQSAGLELQGRF